MKTKFTLAILAVGLIFLSSCSKDFLEPEPTNKISDKDAFTSYAKAKTVLVGAYDALSSYRSFGLYSSVVSDIMGEDMFVMSVNNYGRFVSQYQYNWQANSSYAYDMWYRGYRAIDLANLIIANANNIPDATDAQKNVLVAQAKAIRAYNYHMLVRYYAPAFSNDKSAAGMILIKEPQSAVSAHSKRSTVEQTYSLIVSDLLDAEKYLTSEKDKGRFDLQSVQATLARVYLDMENWKDAAAYARLAYKGFNLMDEKAYKSGFNTFSSETLLALNFTSDDNPIFMSIPSFFYYCDGTNGVDKKGKPVLTNLQAGYSCLRFTNNFVSLFSDNDVRKSLFPIYPKVLDEGQITTKYRSVTLSSMGYAVISLIRASEMHLIEAEAEANLGNSTIAQDALFEVQGKRVKESVKSKATGLDLLNEIYTERRKELFGEGFRLFDIKRLKQKMVRTGTDSWSLISIEANSPRFDLPIPQQEIDANKAIDEKDQNVYYRK
jgi:hypothetical protein